MSLLISFSEFSIFTSLKIQNKDQKNFPYHFKKTNLILYENLKKSSTLTIEILKKNGTIENGIKNGFKYIQGNETKSIETSSHFLFFNHYIKNDESDGLHQKTIYKEKTDNKNSKIKILEFKNGYFTNIEDFTRNSNIKDELYHTIKNRNIYNQFYHKIPLISSLFTEKNKFVKRNISPYQIKLINSNNIPEPFEASSITVKEPTETKIINVINLKDNSIKKKKSKEEKFNFIPQNFLINFNIKEINIQNVLFNHIQEIFPNFMEISFVENFWNNMCKKIINLKKENILKYINGEYIVFKPIAFEEKKDKIFLQNKRKPSINYNDKSKEYENTQLIRNNNNNNKRITKKEKKLNKIKNSKNGEYIDVYLNQIHIKKNYFKGYPFISTLSGIDNFKIHILKGIFKINGLDLKEKPNLTKDNRNLKYIKNKRFELIYENKEKSKQYIVYINNFNFLNLILYYDYKIKEKLLSIEDLFIRHQSKEKIFDEINIAENLIKKYNQIIKEISK